ncbi:peptidylprolyl isomerase [Alicyclobacillus vulcanalis]|uniref:Peptidyl-prolyl cis-trans isomerase n=1 Tax=Alicyclobacillus vulcanalis TaxID=252246 RepID=A0A1N7M065_9BACL|nr:peptidylprolyl isomerase [Alicyclobacillus vulcanalis]SIS79485.1 Peptidyl-prolyl cis-trans isomerase (rotamase)-cyclophilin family [Alicyclobacillus vulcanalis]
MKRRTLLAGITLAALVAVAGCGTPAGNTASPDNTANLSNTNAPDTLSNETGQTLDTANPPYLHTSTEQWKSMPKMFINPNKTYDAIVHTNYGTFTIQLFAKDAPITVNNFVFLAEHNFYHDCTFFRIVKNFVIQTGDPRNDGTGGPGYTIPDELSHQVPFTKGIVAMANTGQPHTGGSQFFICTANDTQVFQPPNNRYTEFGRVISGMDVIDKIAAIPVTENPMTQEDSYPLKTAYIESIQIQES